MLEATKRRSGDNEENLRIYLRCRWTRISLQGEHSISSIFWMPNGSTIETIIWVIENLLAVTLIYTTDSNLGSLHEVSQINIVHGFVAFYDIFTHFWAETNENFFKRSKSLK